VIRSLEPWDPHVLLATLTDIPAKQICLGARLSRESPGMPGHYILATAGHVDHGKSALVKALTGTDPDRLPEERARGITIDLGFAHLVLPANAVSSGEPSFVPQAPSSELRALSYELGVVDVPGHEDFVKNMVAGVGSIDLALLVVAADDGWMPQTEEHLQILSYLGVNHGVVALAKTDLAQNAAECVDDVRRHLQGSSLQLAPIVPTSVLTGQGIPELRDTLVQVLAGTPRPRDIGKPRLSVDRVFVVRGVGTVVTGTLAGGTLKRGQPVCLQPRGLSTRIRGIQSHNQEIHVALPGTRVALNLPDLDAAVDVARGNVVTTSDAGEATGTVDVVLAKSSRLVDTQVAAARPVKDGALVRVHLGSANVPARVRLAGEPLTAGQNSVAQLRLEGSALAFAGDRFIVRDWSEQTTLAGGVVLLPDAPRTGWMREEHQTFLVATQTAMHSVAQLTRAWLQREHAVRRDRLLRQSRFSPEEIATGSASLVEAQQARAAGNWVIDSAWWSDLSQEAGHRIQSHHQSHPELPGFPLTELKSAFSKRVPSSDVLDLLIRDLTAHGYVMQGNEIRRSDFRPALPPHLQEAGEQLRQRLTLEGLDVPSRKELAPDGISKQALRYLIQNGEAMELSPEVVVGIAAWTRARITVRRILRQRIRATTSELRQALGSNRRITIPLLEQLDRQGLTQREGDHRVLRTSS
jgi:selenocysteine-specific elongation factor